MKPTRINKHQERDLKEQLEEAYAAGTITKEEYNEEITKIDKQCRDSVRGIRLWDTESTVHDMQVVVYVMCGGGILGSMAAEQPADFYIDSRHGTTPYPPKKIMEAVRFLKETAIYNGMDPKKLPSLSLHNMGVF